MLCSTENMDHRVLCSTSGILLGWICISVLGSTTSIAKLHAAEAKGLIACCGT